MRAVIQKALLTVTVCTAITAIYVLGRWAEMYPQTRNFNQFTIWRDDLGPTGKITTEWCLFRDADFPTGKCEILFDVPMSTIGLALLAISIASGLVYAGSSRLTRSRKTMAPEYRPALPRAPR